MTDALEKAISEFMHEQDGIMSTRDVELLLDIVDAKVNAILDAREEKAEPAALDAGDPEHWGADGAKWAAAFRKTAIGLGYSEMDEGWLIGWFANAIERGLLAHPDTERDARIAELERNIDALCDGRIKTLPLKQAERRAEKAEAALAELREKVRNELAGVPSILRNPVYPVDDNVDEAERRVQRALALVDPIEESGTHPAPIDDGRVLTPEERSYLEKVTIEMHRAAAAALEARKPRRPLIR